MQVIDIDQMKDAIKHICLRMNDPIGVLGPSGCGKTEGFFQACEEEGAILLPVLLGQYDSVDLKGTPWVRTHDNGHQDTVWHPASTLPFKGNPDFDENGPPILLFLDEITSASVPVMGVCYQLTQERRVGEHKLKDNVRVGCAGNRATDKGIVNRMPSPLDNRITWYETQPSVPGWAKHAQKMGVDPVFVAFLTWQKTKLMTFDPARPEKAFATSRSWMRSARYWSDTTMPTWLKEASISGSIGAGLCAEFYAFVEHWKMIAKLMPRILKSPETAEVPTEPSMQYAVAVSISGSMKDDHTCTAYNTYLKRMPPEFAVMAWSLAMARDQNIHQMKAFIDFSKANKAIWQ